MSLESASIVCRYQRLGLTFHNACANGNLKMVKIYLAQKGFDVNGVDDYGRTGFHVACLFGKLNVVQLALWV